jgi:Holliday junction resolvase RusA-like endonuclease
MMFTPIRLHIPTLVKPKLRARHMKSGHSYTPKQTVSFEAELRWHWQASKHQMIPKCPTSVTIACYLPKPPSTKKSVLLPIVKPDLDNCAKSILDALNGFAWADDNQITDLQICKRYGDAKISILIEPVIHGGP